MAEQVTRSIIVRLGVQSVFELWASFETFPTFMERIRSVKKTGEKTSHWVMRGPLGSDLEWDAETTRFEPPIRIAWHSLPESEVRTSGQVTFNALGSEETEITAILHYVPPAGAAGELIAQLFANPGRALESDLRRFKAFAEGRVPAYAGSSADR